eukprot:scaffold18343_cov90-Isochrysis_galbana.AAC.1
MEMIRGGRDGPGTGSGRDAGCEEFRHGLIKEHEHGTKRLSFSPLIKVFSTSKERREGSGLAPTQGRCRPRIERGLRVPDAALAVHSEANSVRERSHRTSPP